MTGQRGSYWFLQCVPPGAFNGMQNSYQASDGIDLAMMIPPAKYKTSKNYP